MPCYSRITTKLTSGAHLEKALKALGYDVDVVGNHSGVTGTKYGRRIVFSKAGETYQVSGDTAKLKDIQRKYAEVGVREWAKRSGYTVQSNVDGKMTLVNRRG